MSRMRRTLKKVLSHAIITDMLYLKCGQKLHQG
jgi:hypothetical protein